MPSLSLSRGENPVPESLQLLLFSLDERRYALHLHAVERTDRMVEITPLPQAPDIVLGIINVHGTVAPVLDIRKRFHLPERAAGLNSQLIIARTRRRLVAIVADAVNEVATLPEEEMVQPDGILPQLEHVDGVALLDGGMVLIHDLDAFLSLDEEQALDAAIEGSL
jgi:purine-binding chemotaxis protein CheW